MGFIADIAGAVIGKQSANKAAKAASQGFNYLQGNQIVNQTQQQGLQAGAQMGALLGLGGNQAAAEQAFQNYQGSTGYQFRLGQGISGITQNRAVAGLLNSGSTLKGITEYGQNLASSEFQNYLGQLGSMQGTGLNAAYNVASQGTSAGATSGQFIREGAADLAGGLSSALGHAGQYMTNRGSNFGFFG